MRRIKVVLLLLLVALAIASALYALQPLIFKAQKTKEIKETNEKFYETIQEIQDRLPDEDVIPYEGLLTVMRQYNHWLYELKQSGLTGPDSYEESPFILTNFGLPNNTFGVINIPKMSLEMPLFLGASEENMAAGAAVLAQTSIPIGGINTNAVIAGHRGWNGYDYFKQIELLETGDEVRITNLWNTLTYKVSEIQIITPDDVDAILIRPGRDMVTLLTCHPYASGGQYRYLVFCERSETNLGGENPVFLP